MGAESSPVSMKLVNDHIFQIGKDKIKPIAAVIWQKSRIQHFRIGQDNVGAFPYPAPLRLHRIPVIDSCVDPSFSKILQHRLQSPVLIAGQGFSRIDKDCSGQRILQDLLKHRQKKAEGLPAGGGSSDHYMFPLLGLLVHLRLVAVQTGDPFQFQKFPDIRVERRGKLLIHRLSLRHYLPVYGKIFCIHMLSPSFLVNFRYFFQIYSSEI